MIKSQKLHHAVTENAKLQVRLISEYKDDDNNIINTEYEDPYTPALIVIPEPEEVIVDPLDPVPEELEPEQAEEESVPEPESVLDICGYNMHGWDQRSKDIIIAIDAAGITQSLPTGTGVEETVNYDMVVETDGRIALRKITRTFDSGKEISKKFHRSWITPGDTTDNAFAMAFYTPAIIEQYGILNPPAPVVPPTTEEIIKNMTAALDNHIDSTAKEKGYDSRITCALRASEPTGPFYEEGRAFLLWMDSCYLVANQIMGDVQAGEREIPTTELFISEMPDMVWPSQT